MKKMQSDLSRHEAEIFGRYILKKQPNDYCVDLYEQAMMKLNIIIGNKDKKILMFILKNPWSIGLVDAGLCMFHKESAVRRKIFTLFAIIETSPEYCHYFLPHKQSPVYLIYILWAGFRGVMKAILGGLLLKLI